MSKEEKKWRSAKNSGNGLEQRVGRTLHIMSI